MTLTDIQRAALVLFAMREVGPDGTLDQMKAVCHIIRNRVLAGWSESDWLAVLADHPRVSACDVSQNIFESAKTADRKLQLLGRDVDEIYFGQAGDEIATVCAKQDKDHGPILYWAFIDRPVFGWFALNIVKNPTEHKQRAQVGNFMYLYE